MPVAKCTAIFSSVTQGWSESYSRVAVGYVDALAVMTTLMNARCLFLGTPNTIPFIRISFSSPGVVNSKLFRTGLVATSGQSADTPWQSALIRVIAAAGQKRQLMCRGFPDASIIGGALNPQGLAATGLVSFCSQLFDPANGWSLSGQDHTVVLSPILSVTGAGVVTLSLDIGVTGTGQRVQFFRTKDDQGDPVRGIFQVTQFTSPTVFTIGPWPPGLVVNMGRMFKRSILFSQIVNADVQDARSRRVGRPFGLLAGRRRRRV